jgi:ribonucleoside-diphosphate reductase alpha chain
MGKHRDAAYAIDRDRAAPAEPLARRGARGLGRGRALGEQHGYRNAQATVLAPTGTIGLLMDCDTTGIEPDFALVKFKKLAGGGYFKIVNQSVPRRCAPRLQPRAGRGDRRVRERHQHLPRARRWSTARPRGQGLHRDDIGRVEAALPGVFDRARPFAVGHARPTLRERLGVEESVQQARLLAAQAHWGFTRREIDEPQRRADRPHDGRGRAAPARAEHYPVFDCANRCGKHGKRYLAPMSHVR